MTDITTPDAIHPIERAITLAGLSQEAFAQQVGVTQSAVSQWLKGSTAVNVRHYANIERVTHGAVRGSDLIAYEQRRLAARAAAKAS